MAPSEDRMRIRELTERIKALQEELARAKEERSRLRASSKNDPE